MIILLFYRYTKKSCKDSIFLLKSVDIILKSSYYINIPKTYKQGEKKMFADITINQQEQDFQEQKALLD